MGFITVPHTHPSPTSVEINMGISMDTEALWQSARSHYSCGKSHTVTRQIKNVSVNSRTVHVTGSACSTQATDCSMMCTRMMLCSVSAGKRSLHTVHVVTW